MADPVADRSGFLCTYMSTHPDTLVAYVKHFGKVDGHVSSAKMLSIDSKVRSTPPIHPPQQGKTKRPIKKIREWTWNTR
jgi:hypothetical protein